MMNGPPLQAKLSFAPGDRNVLVSVDDGIEALLGIGANSFRSGEVRFQDCVHGDDADVVSELFLRQTGNESGTVNLRLRHADGRIRCVRGTYEKTAKPGSKDYVLNLVLQDARSLHSSNAQPERLTTIEPMMDFVEEALYFKNRDHVFTALNRAAMGIFCGENLQGRDPVGCTDYDLFPEAYADVSY